MDQFSKKILAASIVLAFGFAGNAWAVDGAAPLPNIAVADSAGVKGDGSTASTANGNTTSADGNTSTADNNGNDNSTNSSTADNNGNDNSTNSSTADNNGNDNKFN
ncbi:MAG: hypothetical protein P0107_03320 [Nitrosomonas sp.]|nr:hypothetical protein [Nitrosomonas sp.]